MLPPDLVSALGRAGIVCASTRDLYIPRAVNNSHAGIESVSNESMVRYLFSRMFAELMCIDVAQCLNIMSFVLADLTMVAILEPQISRTTRIDTKVIPLFLVHTSKMIEVEGTLRGRLGQPRDERISDPPISQGTQVCHELASK